MRTSYIGTEHLLRALLHEEGTAAGLLLAANGLRLDDARKILPKYEAPRVGEEMILFLARSEMEPGKFRLFGNAFGAFRISAGKVASFTAVAAQRRGDSPQTFQEFERDLRRLVAR